MGPEEFVRARISAVMDAARSGMRPMEICARYDVTEDQLLRDLADGVRMEAVKEAAKEPHPKLCYLDDVVRAKVHQGAADGKGAGADGVPGARA